MSTATERAAARYARGMAASVGGHPVVAARQFRAALRQLEDRPPPAEATAELRGRILIGLAWVEAEQGRTDRGFRLLDQAEAVLPTYLRALLHSQRGLLLWRRGRYRPAVQEYHAAIALLD